jgi:hypothetical protein
MAQMKAMYIVCMGHKLVFSDGPSVCNNASNHWALILILRTGRRGERERYQKGEDGGGGVAGWSVSNGMKCGKIFTLLYITYNYGNGVLTECKTWFEIYDPWIRRLLTDQQTRRSQLHAVQLISSAREVNERNEREIRVHGAGISHIPFSPYPFTVFILWPHWLGAERDIDHQYTVGNSHPTIPSRLGPHV